MNQIQQTSEILGLGRNIKTFYQLDNKVKHRLPKDSCDKVINTIFLGKKTEEATQFKRIIVPRGSAHKESLTEHQSEQVSRLARIYARALNVLGNQEAAKEFLLKPHRELYNKRPLNVALTDLGAIQVEDLLEQIYYGIPS